MSPGWQRRGIGRRLLECLLGEMATMGCEPAWVVTEADNAAARALYRRLGSQMDGLVMYEFRAER